MCYRKLIVVLAVLTALSFGSALTVKADAVTFAVGNNPQPNEENILLSSGLSGNPVFGLTNQSNLAVMFSSTIDTLLEPSSGQARIEALDGLVNNITISVPGGGFTDLIVNPFQGTGTAMVTAITLNNEVFTFSYAFGSGQNFLTLLATTGAFSSVTINAAGGFSDLRQPRISGAGLIAAIPEPMTMMLLGTGLSGLAIKLRRRSRSTK